MRQVKLLLIPILMLFLVSCASAPKSIDHAKIMEYNKKIEAEIMGYGIKEVVGQIPEDKVQEYMTILERELHKNLTAKMVQGIAKDKNILTVIFNTETLFPDDSYIPFVKSYDPIDRIAKVLKRFPHTIIFVTGNRYTLNSRAEYRLTEARAITMGEILVQRGVSALRIHAIGLNNYMAVPFIKDLDGRLHLVIIPITS